ncbi:MAG: tRNA 2-thiocytidine(32) synthetase TtcA [Planctomycetota bacterium]
MGQPLPIAAPSASDTASAADYGPAARRLRKAVGQAVVGYRMLADGDRVMVALSGGKDSYSLLVLLDELRARAPIGFELVPVHLDQKQPGYDGRGLREWLEARGGEFHILEEDTYSLVTEKVPEGKTYCGLCSRLRRGILYTTAKRLGCTKIALGHHRDDAIETLLLNQFFSGKLETMPPIFDADDGSNTVIRPLFLCAEADLATFAAGQAFPIVPCNLCGSQADLWRRQVKELLAELEQRIPELRNSLAGALQNVSPSHLADRALWERLGLSPGQRPPAGPRSDRPSPDRG